MPKGHIQRMMETCPKDTGGRLKGLPLTESETSANE